MKVQWHWIKDNNFPEDGQDVQCIYKSCMDDRYIRFSQDLTYYEDLYELDNFDFSEYKNKHKNGFVYLDSEWGWVRVNSIVAWCETPDLPEYIREED